MPIGPAKRDALQEWEGFIQAVSHLLLRKPAMVFQEAANQPDGSAPARAAQRLQTEGRRQQPWLRRANKARQRSACVMTMAGHTGDVSCCAFSPDGARIVSGSADGTLRLWDSRTGEQLAVLDGHGFGGVAHCAYSPDRSLILSSVGEVAENAERVKGQASDISLWDAKSGAHVRSLAGDKRPRGRIVACSFSPDGSRILAGGGEYSPGWLSVWEAATGREIFSLAGKQRLCACSWSHDGGRILAAWDFEHSLQAIDARTGHVLLRIPTGSWDPTSCAFSPGGHYILFVDFYHLWLRDAHTGDAVSDFEPPCFSLQDCAFSPDGSRFAARSIEVSDSAVTLWDPEAGGQIGRLGLARETTEAIAFSPDGSRLATAHGNGTLKIWSASSGAEIAALTGHGGPAISCRFSPDGALVVSASRDGTLKLWDPARAVAQSTPAQNEEPIGRVVLCPDGTIATRSSEPHPIVPVYLIHRWDADSATLRFTLRIPLPQRDSMLKDWAFSPDGRIVVSWGENRSTQGPSGELLAWDAETGSRLGEMRGHERMVWDCAFSPDSRRLASIDCADLRIWDTSSLAQLALAPSRQGELGFLVRYSPGGATILTDCRGALPDSNRGLLLLDSETAEPVVDFPGLQPPCAFAPDGSLVLARENFRPRIFKLCSTVTGKEEAILPDHASDQCDGCSFSPDGRFVAIACRPELKLWNVRSGRVLAALAGEAPFAFSPDGGMIAFAGNGARLAIWDLARLSPVCEQDTGGRVVALVWRPDGAGIVVSGAGGRVQFLKLENVKTEPAIVTAWTWKDTCAYCCPRCGHWSEASPAGAGTCLDCPRCGVGLRLNWSTVEADWRPVAASRAASRRS